MSSQRKVYLMWAPNADVRLFDNWADCKQALDATPGARCKGFTDVAEATAIYRGDSEKAAETIRAIGRMLAPKSVDFSLIPDIVLDSIAVDASCPGNPGPMEYRGVYVRTGQELFRVGPYADGTNNIGEFLALVHGIAFLAQKGQPKMPIYSDSRVGRLWLEHRQPKSKVEPTAANLPLRQVMQRAVNWLNTHTYSNPILVWNTKEWGEIPADFGRK